MDLIKGVYQMSIDLLCLPTPMRQHAKVNNLKTELLAKQMLDDGKVNFYSSEPQEVAEKKNELFIVLRELTASAINYCYWYGNSLIRPNGANSSKMYELVDTALNAEWKKIDPDLGIVSTRYYERLYATCIDYLIELLSIERFPLLEERKRHLLELTENGKAITFSNYVIHNKDKDGYGVFFDLVKNFSGFASDSFLKRASLFIIQLNRQLGWFGELVDKLFVPADYQVPKMLQHFGSIEYSNDLGFKIQEGKLIEKGSLMEVQLRAATVMACKEIMKLTGWNISEVDTWLWTKRKEPKSKFHLTYTTDY